MLGREKKKKLHCDKQQLQRKHQEGKRDVELASAGKHSAYEMCLSRVFLHFLAQEGSLSNRLLINISKADKGEAVFLSKVYSFGEDLTPAALACVFSSFL